jgi:hypothetical protein
MAWLIYYKMRVNVHTRYQKGKKKQKRKNDALK